MTRPYISVELQAQVLADSGQFPTTYVGYRSVNFMMRCNRARDVGGHCGKLEAACAMGVGESDDRMRIKVKWTSCGHRKQMVVICFYDYADGYRQSVGYLCGECLQHQSRQIIGSWFEQSTTKVLLYRALYADKVGEIRVVFARVAGAEVALPDARLLALPGELEERKLAHAQYLQGLFGTRQALSAEKVVAGISFRVETDATVSDYRR